MPYYWTITGQVSVHDKRAPCHPDRDPCSGDSRDGPDAPGDLRSDELGDGGWQGLWHQATVDP